MTNSFIADKNVGDVVKLMENGEYVNYIIVHKGLPSSIYDESCDGVWLLREKAHTKMVWDDRTNLDADRGNYYETSLIHRWLNSNFLDSVDPRIAAAIKTVKIPYKKDKGNESMAVQSGSSGLSCKVFLLSGFEVGFTSSDYDGRFFADGARLSYFLSGNTDTSAKSRRICQDSAGNAVMWWLRSPIKDESFRVWCIKTNGEYHYDSYYGLNHPQVWARPAFVVPYTVLVEPNNCLSTNTLPVITGDKEGYLGTLTSSFICNYSVDDEDAEDSLSVIETVDGIEKRRFDAEKNRQYVLALEGTDWLKITNGDHTVNIACSDGKDTVDHTVTFSRNQTSAFVTLNAPLEADDVIRFCSLRVDGAFPSDTIMTCEVTNNALNDDPVWEDCTLKVKAGLTYTFKNRSAENGFAFNFRVAVKRGGSGIGGYITKISGGFE